jgi:thiosulfate dehydrogenase [quinone] large subunit
MSLQPVTLSEKIRLYALTLLRIVIGWHFLYEGISKAFTPAWSSADFLLLTGCLQVFPLEAQNQSVLRVDLQLHSPIIMGLSLFTGLFGQTSCHIRQVLLPVLLQIRH